ncbi:hypothetical protein [Pseudomonas sp. NBRC 111124]|uniref:hypothetical protein n=1 Tax=Pseudomonas sp. NBRC 111124 TaxID=1661039 RepID=UPI000761A765|nr:hypothetical protein [Pseudomonas sp. NBRC 111124]
MLEDITDGQPNLLPVDALEDPLRVEIPMWPISLPSENDPETLRFYWNGVVHTTKTFTSTVLPADLIIEVGTEYLLHGRPTLYYEVQIYNGEHGRSGELQLTIDREAPVLGGDEGMLVFPDEVVNNGVTAHYLEVNDDQLQALVPGYKTPEVGDTITYFWNRKHNDEEYAGELTLKQADIGGPLTLVFDGQMIRDREDGVRYAYYRIKDRAGNQSPRARIVDLEVAAEIAPRQLPWPELPKASGAGATLTLDLKKLSGDLVGMLPEAAEIYPEDTLTLQWGVPGELGAVTIAESDAKGQFLIPRDKLAMQSGKTLPFYYQVATFDGQVLESVTPHRQVEVLAYIPYFPIPQIKEAIVGYLKLSDVIGSAHFRIATWTYVSTDHLLRFELKGHDLNGQAVAYPVEAYKVTEGDITSRLIGGDDTLFVPKAWLEALKVGTQLQLTATVSFDGGHSWPPSPNLGTLDLQLLA